MARNDGERDQLGRFRPGNKLQRVATRAAAESRKCDPDNVAMLFAQADPADVTAVVKRLFAAAKNGERWAVEHVIARVFGPISACKGSTVGIVGPAVVQAASLTDADGTADVLSQMTPVQRAAVAAVLAQPDDLGDEDDDPAEPTCRPGADHDDDSKAAAETV